MATVNLYAGNNTLDVEITGLKLRSTGAYILDATVSVTIYTSAGVEVSGGIWPLPMAYVAASNGNYLGKVTHLTTLVDGEKYKIVISAEDTLSNKGEWIEWAVAKKRRF